MSMVGYFAGQLLGELPTLLVLLVGLVLLAVRRRALAPRSAGLAFAGVALLLSRLVLQLVWGAFSWSLLPGAEAATFALSPRILAGFAIFLALLQATGAALLIAAVLTGGGRRRDHGGWEAGATPPAA